MTWYGILGVVASVIGITVVLWQIVLWVQRRLLHPLRVVLDEVTHNGGNSMKDHLQQMCEGMAAAYQELKDLKEDTARSFARTDQHLVRQDRKMDEHLRDHANHK